MSLSGVELGQMRALIHSVLDEREKAKANQPEPARRDLTKTEFAKAKGVSRTTVYKWIEEGFLEVTPTGRIAAQEAKRHGI